ncbi:MAG: hypothetical protein A3I75_02960 [Deltaproteobacteria bacterium RIFCSPLOWO2_02_FULL_50_16]|nr:MAG: hypothetical protein A3B79_06850 [Deltaproteobacteria bacterium RIFCSPHIGHO2_02_FULL_50_15]OGQ56906.1 MAG: hypothetical protein A3I75_02960 [Deltaproteobacteria bacterium RIFCSPLOWO2_02_FULL_50_16]OGQ67916.1 MAG: hypothetical protein A3F89_03280 [Deltaproteobacteria bacterium RIFCSPLOWO2_12_FULL_50_11]
MSKFEKNLHDIRTKNIYINQRKLSQKDWDKHLNHLPDCSKDSVEIFVYDESEEKTATGETSQEPQGNLANHTGFGDTKNLENS